MNYCPFEVATQTPYVTRAVESCHQAADDLLTSVITSLSNTTTLDSDDSETQKILAAIRISTDSEYAAFLNFTKDSLLLEDIYSNAHESPADNISLKPPKYARKLFATLFKDHKYILKQCIATEILLPISPDLPPKKAIFIPLGKSKSDKSEHAIVLLNPRWQRLFTEDVLFVLQRLFQHTDYFSHIKNSSYLKSTIQDDFKERFGYVSANMYEDRFKSFQKSLNTIKVEFEPIVYFDVEAQAIRIWGVEALARRQDQTPFDTFRTAEIWGVRFQTELDIYILLTALDSYHASMKKAEKKDLIPLSINMYPNTLLSENYRKQVIRSLYEHQFSGEKLILEISERAIIGHGDSEKNDLSAFNKARKELTAFNVQFAIDDFGSGYSSISRILKIHPEYVKIDRDLLLYSPEIGKEFIRQLVKTQSPQGEKTFEVILEGVDECTHQNLPLSLLIKDLGISYIQGHLMSTSKTEVTTALSREKNDAIKALLGW